jgi:hypothetical protein
MPRSSGEGRRDGGVAERWVETADAEASDGGVWIEGTGVVDRLGRGLGEELSVVEVMQACQGGRSAVARRVGGDAIGLLKSCTVL